MATASTHKFTLAQRAFYAASWAGILAGLILCLTLGFWKLYPYKGLTDVPQPFKIAQTTAPKGTLVTYTVSYCVDQALPLPLTVHRSLELQSLDPNAPLGSLPIAPPIEYEITQRCETRDFFVGLPMYVPVGKYHIHTQTTLQVNPIRQIRQAWQTEDFEVVPAAGSHPQIDDQLVFPSAKTSPYVPKR